MKVVVIGAGVAGLAIGWRLAQAKCEVVVCERGLAGQGASWAAAGMIAAGAETGLDGSPLAEFALASRAAWPAFAREIEAASGMDIGYREPGALLVALNETQENKLRELAATLAASEMPGNWLEAREVLKIEPLLAPDLRGALHAVDAAQVDNRALSSALAASLHRAAGQLRELCQVETLVVESGHVRGVVCNGARLAADAVVVAAGASCNGINGAAREALPPVRPVKGQMLALAPPAGDRMPTHPAWESDVYIVPVRNCLLIGATVEEAGFDTAVSKNAQDWLFTGAIRLAPALAKWRVAESWSGLRPATPDGLPVLGAAGLDGLFVASGQFRNGILFAPKVADCLNDLVMGKPAKPYWHAFDPRRFTSGRTNA
jgi:glycine oxidase